MISAAGPYAAIGAAVAAAALAADAHYLDLAVEPGFVRALAATTGWPRSALEGWAQAPTAAWANTRAVAAAFFAILALAPLTAAVLLACQRSGVRISGPCPPAALHTKPIFEAIRCAATERGPTSLCRLTEQRSKHERSGGPR